MPGEQPQFTPVTPAPASQTPSRKRKWVFVVAFLAIILFAFAAFIGLRLYDRWRGEQAVEQLADALKKAEDEAYARAMADTYGGKTPQETLAMYIAAVEKGDHELASKYFIEKNRERELKSFNGATEKFIREYLGLLKEAVKNEGSYTADKKYFSIDKPIGVRGMLYPNGIWKIIEI